MWPTCLLLLVLMLHDVLDVLVGLDGADPGIK
jgi:hypothetical protein